MHEALLYERRGSEVGCRLCAHYCSIPEGASGRCACRVNEGGALKTLTYGKSTGLSIDPIEKKPFYHFKPGSRALSFGTPGCNFRCKGCQNWFLSQSPRSEEKAFDFPDTPPRAIAEASAKADGIAYTYSEPTIFLEYARDVILETRGLYPEKYHAFVSNGYFSREAWELIEKERLLDAIRIDLKSFSDDFYREYCGARLQPVLDSIKRVHASGVHLELVTLLVPGKNDSREELCELCEWVASLDARVPLHFLRFFPMHEASDLSVTPLKKMKEAKEIAGEAGLQFAYLGNVEGGADTLCPDCGALAIERSGYSVSSNLAGGACPNCGARLRVEW